MLNFTLHLTSTSISFINESVGPVRPLCLSPKMAAYSNRAAATNICVPMTQTSSPLTPLVDGEFLITVLDVLISMRRMVTSSAIRPGIMSAGTKNPIQEATTSRLVGR